MTRGPTTWRAAATGVAELLSDLDEIRGAGQLAGYIAQQTFGFSLTQLFDAVESKRQL